MAHETVTEGDQTVEARTLAQIIREHQAATGESYQAIADRSGLSKTKIAQLAMDAHPNMPRTDTLEKIARGLKMPVKVVTAAALHQRGYSSTDYSDTAMMLLMERYKSLPREWQQFVDDTVASIYERTARRGR